MAVGGAPNTPPNGPPPSQIQTHPPAISFQSNNVPPSQYIYVQDIDQIALFIWSNVTNEFLKFTYRWLTPQGEIKEGTKRIPLAAAGGTTFFPIPLAEGWLISLSVQGVVGISAGEIIFVQVMLQRSPNSLSSGYGLVWQGFAPVNNANGWPGTPSKEIQDGPGTIRSITGSTPAAGAEINETVPSQRRWNLLAFTASLTTSVAVANRSPVLQIDDGANILFLGTNLIVQAASLTFKWSASTLVITGGVQSGAEPLMINLPFPVKTSCRIRTLTGNLQAADQWSAPQYLVQEWGAWDP